MQSSTAWLSTTNAVLFALQAVVNVVYAKSLLKTPRQYETMITPESFAFLIWILIYILEAVVVVIDLVSPQYSVYADASQPSQLRTCFGFSCVANIAWVLLYVKGHVHLATFSMFLLWLALLVLYIYTVNDRQLRSGRSSSIFQVGSQIDWWQYICSELPFALYFSWVTALTLSHVAISLQQHRQTFLPIAVYVLHLSILIIMALVTLHYAHDPIFSLVIIWFLSAIATKHDSFPNEFKTLDASVKSCAAEGVEVIAGLLVISALIMMFTDR